MRCIVIVIALLYSKVCVATVVPVFEYDVPVASQPLVYAPHPYVGSYAVRQPHAISHSYSQTQTHPVTYLKPVTIYGPAQYNQAPVPVATSRVEQTNLFLSQPNRIYRYQQYNSPQQQYKNQAPNRNVQEQRKNGQQQYYSQYNSQNENRNVYANEMPYTNNGEQVKLRRYRVQRPGIKKEFYDIEEKIVVRPAGSVLLELDSPAKKQDITEYNNNGRNYASNYNQYNSQGYVPNNNVDYGQNRQYFATASPDCGSLDQQPVYVYTAQQPEIQPGFQPGVQPGVQQGFQPGFQPGVQPGVQQGIQPGFQPRPQWDNDNSNDNTPQYHPTTFAPPTTTSSTDNFPTTTANNYPTTKNGYQPTKGGNPQAYLPPVVTDQTYSPRCNSEYDSNAAYASSSAQYTPSTESSLASKQSSDIYISSTTPISVTIVDKNDKDDDQNRTSVQNHDILYADTPDQVQNEVPPRGDLSQYRAEQTDQFYYELPSSRYTNEPDRPPQAVSNVYTKSNGEPTPFYYNDRERNSTRNGTSNTGNIELYTENDEDQPSSRYTSNNSQNDQNVGSVRARVISVTPPPATAVPTETVNKRRIVVDVPITTVQEVVEAADNSNSTGNSQNYRQNFNNNANGQYRSNKYNTENNENYYNNNNYDTSKANYEAKKPTSSNGVYISTTPTTASQRIIYVQPVSQDFAQQKATPPKSN